MNIHQRRTASDHAHLMAEATGGHWIWRVRRWWHEQWL